MAGAMALTREIAHCRRCGRRLTDRFSVSRKYGPTCYRRVYGLDIRDKGGGEQPSQSPEPSFKPKRTLLENYGEDIKEVLNRQGKLEDEAALTHVVKDLGQKRFPKK